MSEQNNVVLCAKCCKEPRAPLPNEWDVCAKCAATLPECFRPESMAEPDELTRLREENAALKREAVEAANQCVFDKEIIKWHEDAGKKYEQIIKDLTTRAERAEALLRDIQATELSEHYGNCRDALAMLKIKVDDFLD